MQSICSAPWTGLFVWNDGSISFCGRRKAEGSLVTQTLEEFWNSPPVQAARGLFAEDRYLETGCPPTCCWLTAKRPDMYAANFDIDDYVFPTFETKSCAKAPAHKSPVSYDENQSMLAQQRAAGETALSAYPDFLSLQLYNYCSLRCPMCCFGIIPPELKKPTLNIVPDIVLTRLKALYPYLSYIDLVGGELFDIPFDRNPLVRLLQDLGEHVSPGFRLRITTNGQHLDQRWAEFLLRFRFIDIVSFSIDSFDPAVYAATRVMGSLDRVRRSIAVLQEAKAKIGAQSPEIRMNMLLGLHNCDGIADFVRNAQALGAAHVEFQKLVVMGDPAFYEKNNLYDRRNVAKLRQVWRDLNAVSIPSNRGETISLISAYLNHIGELPRAIAEDSSLPFSAQYDTSEHCGEIWGRHEAAQHFVAKRPRLRHVQLCFATYARRNSKQIIVSIDDERGRTIAKRSFDSASLADNTWRNIDLPPTKLKLGQTYRLRVRSPRSRPGDAVTIRCAPPSQEVASTIAHQLF